jgi:hypothetical protein
MLSNARRCSERLSGVLIGSQMLSNAFKLRLSWAFRGSQRLSEAFRGSQALSEILRRFQRLSDALICSQLLSEALKGIYMFRYARTYVYIYIYLYIYICIGIYTALWPLMVYKKFIVAVLVWGWINFKGHNVDSRQSNNINK